VRTLTQRELNRALLARQLLLERKRLPVHRAIERVGALQAQWPPAPYVALWSRVEGFRRDQLMRAVERRTVVRANLMRMTLHHVSAADYLAFAGVFREHRGTWLERELSRYAEEFDLDRLAAELVEHASERPHTRPELLALLNLPKLVVTDRAPWLVWYAISVRAGLVFAPSASVWRNNTQGAQVVPAAAWLGRKGGSGDDAVAQLVRRYLAAFGPATRADVSQWTGLTRAILAPGIEALTLRRFRDEAGRELLDLPRAPLPPADTPAPVRLLPHWDSALLAHDDRSRILPEEHRKTVIRRNGDVLPTFLVDGVVAGLWRLEGGRVQLDPFGKLTRTVERELRREARGLEELAR
jgi:DNA glycosylase AlkZ-like